MSLREELRNYILTAVAIAGGYTAYRQTYLLNGSQYSLGFMDATIIIGTTIFSVIFWVNYYLDWKKAKTQSPSSLQSAHPVEVSREVIGASERLNIMPVLSIDAIQPLSDSQGKYARFSVLNHGKGAAKITNEHASMKDGKRLKIQRHSKGTIIDVQIPFYWDILEVKEGDEVVVKIGFTDIIGTTYPDFTTTFKVS